MPIVAVDDTDSRERGMCTTYVGVRLGERLEAIGGTVERRLLVRLNPAVKHKTRGNAAVAVHASGIDAEEAFRVAAETVREFAAADDPRTSPGVVVADIDIAGLDLEATHPDGHNAPDPDDEQGGEPTTVIPDAVAAFSRRALRERLTLEEATALADAHGYRHAGFGSGGAAGAETPGRGRIGALAAVGAPATLDDRSYERISYRELDRCGTPREVDAESVFTAADREYPTVWDTVDRGTGEVVCVPNAPGPILHGIRGDDADACRRVADEIESEPVERVATFVTNQGTDTHLADGRIDALRDGAGYRVSGVVASDPETKRGGHVHVDIAEDRPAENGEREGPHVDGSPADRRPANEPATEPALRAIAFAPTGRFRDRVWALRPDDRVTLCGEHERRASDPGPDGTLKLEKLAVRELVRTEPATPTCPDCGRRMSSAGRDQGYRCRDCGTTAPGKVSEPIDRALEPGWYEVPPSARRHVAKPLVRGGFDAPTHPER